MAVMTGTGGTPTGVGASTGGRPAPYGPSTGTGRDAGPTTTRPGADDPSLPPPPGSTPSTPATQALMAELRSAFPWVDQIGLDVGFFQELVASSASADEIVVKLRQQPQYKQRFPGMWRSDGSMRMNESEYLRTEVQMRQVLSQHGFEQQYQTPASLQALFETDQDVNELAQRLNAYTELKNSSADTLDAFYVYAGMDITVDDLYLATVDEGARQNLLDEYGKRVSGTAFDYQTFISRATERGLQRVVSKLSDLQREGAVTGRAVQELQRVDPNFARSVVDALYTGAGAATDQLNLSELLTSFELAAIGAAARGAGLEMPDRQRVLELRSAGVDRAKAMQAYQTFASRGSKINEAAQRAGQGAFTQSQFEDAALLGNGDAQRRLETALAVEDAAGASQGGFQMQQDRTGRYLQQGLRSI